MSLALSHSLDQSVVTEIVWLDSITGGAVPSHTVITLSLSQFDILSHYFGKALITSSTISLLS